MVLLVTSEHSAKSYCISVLENIIGTQEKAKGIRESPIILIYPV